MSRLSYVDSFHLGRKASICLPGESLAIDRVKIVPFACYLRAILEISKPLGVKVIITNFIAQFGYYRIFDSIRKHAMRDKIAGRREMSDSKLFSWQTKSM